MTHIPAPQRLIEALSEACYYAHDSAGYRVLLKPTRVQSSNYSPHGEPIFGLVLGQYVFWTNAPYYGIETFPAMEVPMALTTDFARVGA
jgi:hypothetical protein